MIRISHVLPIEYHVTYPELSWLKRQGLDMMIEFIGLLYNWLQQFTTHWHSVIFLYWTLSLQLNSWNQSQLSRAGRCGEEKYLLPLSGIELRFLGVPALANQPVALHYTYWTIPAVYNSLYSVTFFIYIYFFAVCFRNFSTETKYFGLPWSPLLHKRSWKCYSIAWGENLWTWMSNSM
jgi:hypothetical protein